MYTAYFLLFMKIRSCLRERDLDRQPQEEEEPSQVRARAQTRSCFEEAGVGPSSESPHVRLQAVWRQQRDQDVLEGKDHRCSKDQRCKTSATVFISLCFRVSGLDPLLQKYFGVIYATLESKILYLLVETGVH